MSSRPAELTFQILSAAACGMTGLLALLPAAGHDQMWLLYSARLWMRGAHLYGPQVFETNPPLGIWLSAIPEKLAGVTHLPDTAVGKLLVIAVAAGAAAWTLRLLRPLIQRFSRANLWWLGFVWVCVIGVMPARDFGQRDHLLAMLVLPYLAAAARRAAGHELEYWEAWLVGLTAGLGICLKPHQVLIPFAVELLLAWTRLRNRSSKRPGRLLRPETGGIVAAGAIFLAAVKLATPLYFKDVLPIARDTYWAFHPLRFSEVISQASQLHVLILVDLALLATLSRQRADPFVSVLLAAGIGSTVAYYLQGTGWYYQQLPALTFFGLALGFLLLQRLRAGFSRPAHWVPFVAAGLGSLALFLTAHFMDYPFTPDRSFPIDTPDPVFFAGLAPGTPVATITTTVDYTVPPVFRYHLVLAQRYPHLWMMPAILRNEDPQGRSVLNLIATTRLAQLDALQHRFMAEDLARWQPRLLLVERCQDSTVHCQVLEDRHDNLLAWFLRDPAFRAQFAHYRYWRSAGPFDGWLRID